MKLSDVVSAARLEFFAEVGLLVSVLAFAAVCVGLFWTGRNSARWEQAAQLPLESDPIAPTDRTSNKFTREER